MRARGRSRAAASDSPRVAGAAGEDVAECTVLPLEAITISCTVLMIQG